MVLGKVGGDTLAAPLARGTGIITSLVGANGLLILPRGVQGAEVGEMVPVRRYAKETDIEFEYVSQPYLFWPQAGILENLVGFPSPPHSRLLLEFDFYKALNPDFASLPGHDAIQRMKLITQDRN